jgi:lysozyme family protein
MVTFTDAWRKQYAAQFASMVIHPDKVKEADETADAIIAHRARYETISKATNGVPWHFIGCLHYREASLDFTKFLGDGEPLDRASVNVPAHMGPWHGPDAFEQGAIAALKHEGFDKITDWSLGGQLFRAEEYNGEGYHDHGLPSPYVFAGTSIYSHGLYLSDGKFSLTVVDHRIGVAAILAALIKKIPDLIPQQPQHGVALMASTVTTSTKSAAPVQTVAVPVETLKTAANVSSATIKTAFGLGSLGSVLAFAGPFLAALFPSQAHAALAIASTVVGAGVAATGFVHALNLSASAEQVTNDFINSIVGEAQQLQDALGGSSA